MNRFGKIVERVAVRYSDKELRELYGEMFRSREPGLSGLISLVTKSIWDIEKVNWPAVRRELEKYPSGRSVIRGMEALPDFADMATKGYWAVMKGKGIPQIGKQPLEWRDLICAWETFERNVLQGLEGEMVEYYMGPGRAELKTASLRIAFQPDFDEAQEFVEYLQDTLIPDLEESKMVETAKDFEMVCKLIGQERKDTSFINYLKHTLIPDLNESGFKATAQDFEEGIYWMMQRR